MTMSGARKFKQRADSVLEEVFRSLFEEIDTDKIRREVEELRASAPDSAAAEYARTLTRRTAIRCAAAGAVTGLPAGLVALGALGADLAYLVYQQFRLILGIATIYGHEPSSRERFSEAFQCLAYTSGVGVGKQSIAAVLESATVEGGVVAEKIGARFARERLAKVIPFVGAVSAGVLNYAAVHAVARAATRYYESRVESDLAAEIWAEGDREHA
jgi:uncharacterized membrane protein YcjF (UPF0283 family)